MNAPDPAEVLRLFRGGKDTIDIARELGLYRAWETRGRTGSAELAFQTPDESRVIQLLEEARFEEWRAKQVAVPA